MIKKIDRKKNLEILGLSGIFQGIADNNKTGVLSISVESQKKHIYFFNGDITMVASPNRPSILAEAMRRSFEQIDDETVEAAFQIQAGTAKSLVSILLEMDANIEFIKNLCCFQIREEVFEIFTWKDIQFEFRENIQVEELFPQELLDLNIAINPGMLLMGAAKRLDEWKIIVDKFPSNNDVPYICKDIYEHQLGTEEFHLLSLIDGVTDIEEIIASCRLSKFRVMQLLYEMYTQHEYIKLKNAQELKEIAELEDCKSNIFKCIKLYERAQDLEKPNIESTIWLAQAYESSGLISKSIVKYKKLGLLFLEQEKFEESLEAFSKVITYSSEDLDAHEQYVNVLFQSNKTKEGAKASILYAKKLSIKNKQEAIQVLENAYQHDPLNAEVLEYMATLYYELDRNLDACFTYTTLANLYKIQKYYAKALDVYKKILILDKNNIEARFELASTYLLIDKQDEGLKEYKLLGDILLSGGFIKDSFGYNYLITVCKKIIEFEPFNLTAKEWLADVYIYRKNYKQSKILLLEILEYLESEEKNNIMVSILQKLVYIEPKNYSFHRKLAEVYHKLEYYEQASKELLCVANLAITEGIKYLKEGKETLSYETFSESLDTLNLVLVIDPFNLEVRQKRAELLHQLGHIDEAISEYKLILNMTKSVHNYHDALTALFHILELASDTEDFAFLEVAKICENQGKIDLAVNFYKKYVRFKINQGDIGEVTYICKRLLSLTQNDPEVAKWRSFTSNFIDNSNIAKIET